MRQKEAPPDWEVQLTRWTDDGFEIETHGPYDNRQAQQLAALLKVARSNRDKAIEVNRISDQQEPLQW